MAGHILMFDSGIGGISVYREIKKRLPTLDVDYLFDNAFYPYGQLSEPQLVERLEKIIGQVIAQEQPALVVVACNSASTAALPSLRQAYDIPIVGVVPAIKPAAMITQTNTIGLLATKGTVDREYIASLIEQHANHCDVIKVGSNELVAMAEEAYRGESPCMERLAEICAPFNEGVDTLVLGCTHFPLLAQHIRTVTGTALTLVDSGEAIAKRVEHQLNIKGKKMPARKFDRAFYTKANLDEALMTALSNEGFVELTLI